MGVVVVNHIIGIGNFCNRHITMVATKIVLYLNRKIKKIKKAETKKSKTENKITKKIENTKQNKMKTKEK